MALGMKRLELQRMAQTKLDDATLLVESKRFSNGYYLAGYAVELGLKACIARQIVAETIPDKRFIDDTYKHDLKRLVGVAGLARELRDHEFGNSAFAANWAVVTEWNPETRYTSVDPYSSSF